MLNSSLATQLESVRITADITVKLNLKLIMPKQLAVYSGYEMLPNDFKTFIYSLRPELEDEPLDLQLQKCILAYDSWRRRLPREDLRSAPKLRRESSLSIFPYWLIPMYHLQVHYKSTSPDAIPNQLFFPLRYTDLKGLRQFEESDPDSLRAKTETETDKARLEAFIRFIALHGGKLDPNTISFGYMTDIHPYFDDRAVYSL